MPEEIGIIGFGISGIAACRWAIHYGFKPVVYEKNNSLGGVWLTHNYVNCRLQTTKYSYHFSDMEMLDDLDIYPKGQDVLEYIKTYVSKHNLEKYVQYNANVQSLKKVDNAWEIIVDGNKFSYKYMIVSTGFYGTSINRLSNSLLPNDIINPKETFRDKNVIVVGNGPSGCDMACLVVENMAEKVKLLYRTPRWIFSRFAGMFSLHFFTWRFFLTIAYYLPRPILRILLILLYLIPIFWYGYKLQIEFPEEKVSRYNLVLNDLLYYYVNHNFIEMKREPVVSIEEKYVITTKDKYEYDIVVDATGYKSGIPLIGYYDKIPKLYRNILIPGDSSIAFIGYVASFSWVQVSELQCHWYYRHILGKFGIPNQEKQQQTIGEIIGRDYHDYAYLVYFYINLLRKDMGLREFNNWFSLPSKVILENELLH